MRPLGRFRCGARMMGIGSEGCHAALVQTKAAPAFAGAVVSRHRAETGIEPGAYVCEATNGAEVVLGQR